MTTKHGFFLGIALGLAFTLGCGAAVVWIPPARAQSIQRWEYLEIKHGWDDGLWANRAGREGWELVQVGRGGVNHSMYFRRPLP